MKTKHVIKSLADIPLETVPANPAAADLDPSALPSGITPPGTPAKVLPPPARVGTLLLGLYGRRDDRLAASHSWFHGGLNE
jgi:hypothetical protein